MHIQSSPSAYYGTVTSKFSKEIDEVSNRREVLPGDRPVTRLSAVQWMIGLRLLLGWLFLSARFKDLQHFGWFTYAMSSKRNCSARGLHRKPLIMSWRTPEELATHGPPFGRGIDTRNDNRDREFAASAQKIKTGGGSSGRAK